MRNLGVLTSTDFTTFHPDYEARRVTKKIMKTTDEIRSEYDFSKGVRGKHHKAYEQGSNVISIKGVRVIDLVFSPYNPLIFDLHREVMAMLFVPFVPQPVV